MADPQRQNDGPLATPAGRETRIEELLLAGLDHYFNEQHELAVSVWTRVLFLDRSHARARAYIERARSAIAERQREGEELLQTGAAAFQRGDAAGARQLLTSAVERGASADEALALLDRLDRLAPAGDVSDTPRDSRPRRRQVDQASAPQSSGPRAITLLLVLAVGLAAGALVVIYWTTAGLPWSGASAQLPAFASRPADEPLPVPAAAEVSLSRAQALYVKGRLHEALAALEGIRPGESLRSEADDLRTEIQHRLLDAARSSSPPPAAPAAPPR
jgi:hypothetical protein